MMVKSLSNKETQFVTKRYNRFAPLYNIMESPLEYFLYRRWRNQLWDVIEGEEILEMGVGTGKNISFYPDEGHITAIDISGNMLKRARIKAMEHEGKRVELLEMDIQKMSFPDQSFDAVVATFVFCSVPDPVRGLKEAFRVTKPSGKLYLLEHMLATANILQPVMRFLDKPIYNISGVHIARKTVSNIKKAGWQIENVTKYGISGIFRMIVAKK